MSLSSFFLELHTKEHEQALKESSALHNLIEAYTAYSAILQSKTVPQNDSTRLLEYEWRHLKNWKDAKNAIESLEFDKQQADKRAEMWALKNFTYDAFKLDRIRKPVTVEEQLEFREHPFDIKRLGAILRQWKKDNGVIVSLEMIICKLEEEFGSAKDGRYYDAFRVFCSDEDVYEWDKTHPR